MKEMTDRELTDKISQVFDNYEDPTAEYGWLELRKKYPENNRKPILLWWTAAAAILLVAGGLWFMVPDPSEVAQKVTKPNATEQIENDSLLENASKNIGPDIDIPDSPDRPMHVSDRLVNVSEKKSLNNSSRDIQVQSQSMQEGRVLVASPVKIENIVNSAAVSTQLIDNSMAKTPMVSLPENTSAALPKNSPEATRDSLINATAKMLALAQENPAADNHTHKVKETPYASQKTSAKNYVFSFYAGSYFNYSLGSETKLNFGAGFTSDIKLANNLRLSTGLALANNSLTYNDGVPSSGKEKLHFDALPSFGSGNNNNLTTITKYDADLLALDIPINIKYLIIPKDNKLYLLAGLSSGTYLSETYALDYRNYSAMGTYVSQTQGAEVKKQLQAFDLARTLNISFGYSANLGKTQNITIEPFLKYPLGGLGSEDLKFGSTGINLKLNFSQFRKR